MCGIVGINYKSEEDLKLMLSSIFHRGPDGEGKEISNNFSLGMRRLSIIDPQTGWQPIYNEDKSLCIFFNGEIYNYQSVWKELVKRGHKFKTKHSDTETVLHGYEEWGTDVVLKLTGMFAGVIHDIKNNKLFIVRDRLGIKPLYYCKMGEKFAFASEIKALLQLKWVPKEVNTDILYEFLLYRVHDSKPETFFKDIKRLMPGHFMELDSEGNISNLTQYWKPTFNPEFSSRKSDEEYAQEFYSIYKEVIKRHLIADVPVGVSLSGGLDSSGVVSVMRELLNEGEDLHTSGKLYTFSAIYPGQSIDESSYMKEVENFAETTPIYAKPTVDKFWEDMDSWVYTQEEPTISSAPYAYYSVYREASKYVRVNLSGNGGDELLAGYIPYFRSYATSGLKNKQFLKVAKELIQGLDLYKTFIEDKIDSINPFKSKIQMHDFLGPVYKNNPSSFHFETSKNLNERLMLDVMKYSTPNLLRYEDKNSMAFSIESRVPFLDHKLVEYIFNLPIDQKIKNGWNRYIYRNALKGHMPEKNRLRRSKIGFTNPELQWLRAKKDRINDIFSSKQFINRGLFNHDKLIKNFNIWSNDNNNQHFSGDPLVYWRILITELWIRKYID